MPERNSLVRGESTGTNWRAKQQFYCHSKNKQIIMCSTAFSLCCSRVGVRTLVPSSILFSVLFDYFGGGKIGHSFQHILFCFIIPPLWTAPVQCHHILNLQTFLGGGVDALMLVQWGQASHDWLLCPTSPFRQSHPVEWTTDATCLFFSSRSALSLFSLGQHRCDVGLAPFSHLLVLPF